MLRYSGCVDKMPTSVRLIGKSGGNTETGDNGIPKVEMGFSFFSVFHFGLFGQNGENIFVFRRTQGTISNVHVPEERRNLLQRKGMQRVCRATGCTEQGVPHCTFTRGKWDIFLCELCDFFASFAVKKRMNRKGCKGDT